MRGRERTSESTANANLGLKMCSLRGSSWPTIIAEIYILMKVYAWGNNATHHLFNIENLLVPLRLLMLLLFCCVVIYLLIAVLLFAIFTYDSYIGICLFSSSLSFSFLFNWMHLEFSHREPENLNIYVYTCTFTAITASTLTKQLKNK